MGSFLDKLKGSNNGNGHTPAPPIATPVPAIAAKPKPQVTVTIEEGVVPPDAPPPKLSTEIAAEAVIAEAEAAAAAAFKEADPAPKRRGRPAKGATVSSAATSEPSTEPGPSVILPTVPLVVKQESPAPLQLYIDCLPTKPTGLPITSFEEWLAPIAAAVAKAKGIEDYRLLTYGQGKVELAIAIRKSPVPSGIMVIPHMAPGAEEALSVLKPLASVVVQALR